MSPNGSGWPIFNRLKLCQMKRSDLVAVAIATKAESVPLLAISA
jgi:hypothetical protein